MTMNAKGASVGWPMIDFEQGSGTLRDFIVRQPSPPFWGSARVEKLMKIARSFIEGLSDRGAE